MPGSVNASSDRCTTPTLLPTDLGARRPKPFANEETRIPACALSACRVELRVKLAVEVASEVQ